MQNRQPVTFSIYYVTVNMEMCNKSTLTHMINIYVKKFCWKSSNLGMKTSSKK